ncbi:CYTH domain-containing protein [Solemya velesiana gill symbiont]|uniref:Adenylate cyclase n=1 Tax=Solemya velesiana gill symbiont TaxID=1918948 RepID=A0A1T2KX14_9GAMM|nr:CYTH domain-containing protein [Solemya velesiana gill symbiont]OOZ37385.1 adenylate cyclase [Solemya velesiana gill symbiont]
MATEIERKYLVKNDAWKDSVISESRIKQGYLANQPSMTVRVRVAKGTAFLTVKGSTEGISRAEFEYEIPVPDAEEMLKLNSDQPYIDKTRYKVKCGEHVWDLDVFEGDNSGLIMAEVELDSEDEGFEMPDWAGEEVSGDLRYYNANLINNPYRSW